MAKQIAPRDVHGNITADHLGLIPNLKKSRDLTTRIDFTPNPLDRSEHLKVLKGETSASGHQEVTLSPTHGRPVGKTNPSVYTEGSGRFANISTPGSGVETISHQCDTPSVGKLLHTSTTSESKHLKKLSPVAFTTSSLIKELRWEDELLDETSSGDESGSLGKVTRHMTATPEMSRLETGTLGSKRPILSQEISYLDATPYMSPSGMHRQENLIQAQTLKKKWFQDTRVLTPNQRVHQGANISLCLKVWHIMVQQIGMNSRENTWSS